jgi:NAD(P)H-flavin reductase
MAVKTFPITLVESFMISPNVKHFIFDYNDSPPFAYIAGQFITMHFEKDGKTLRRSYSIANTPKLDNRIEFAAGYVENGPGSQLLFNLKPNDKLNVNGPFGRLILKENTPKRYILVSTSTGVTPYRAMLDQLHEKMSANPELQVILLQGVQKKEDLLYKDEFITFTKHHSNFHFRAHYSREQGAFDNIFEYNGYVQSAFPELDLNPEGDLIYLCGNPGMIDESFEYLKSKDFTIQSIIREKYISR